MEQEVSTVVGQIHTTGIVLSTFIDRHPSLAEIAHELERAQSQHGPIASGHEGIAVIREEYLEAEAEVFKRERDPQALRKELIQLAAMCVRMVEDLRL